MSEARCETTYAQNRTIHIADADGSLSVAGDLPEGFGLVEFGERATLVVPTPDDEGEIEVCASTLDGTPEPLERPGLSSVELTLSCSEGLQVVSQFDGTTDLHIVSVPGTYRLRFTFSVQDERAESDAPADSLLIEAWPEPAAQGHSDAASESADVITIDYGTHVEVLLADENGRPLDPAVAAYRLGSPGPVTISWPYTPLQLWPRIYAELRRESMATGQKKRSTIAQRIIDRPRRGLRRLGDDTVVTLPAQEWAFILEVTRGLQGNYRDGHYDEQWTEPALQQVIDFIAPQLP